MQLVADNQPKKKQSDHFPCGEPATAGSFTLDAAAFENLDGADGRAARIVKRLGLATFCRETNLTRQTARRIRDRGLSKNSRSWLAVIACLKKHEG